MKKHIPADLLRLKKQFKVWRQTRPGKAKIPENLFNEAVQLSFKYQLAFVCKHLGLSYMDSKIKIQKMTPLSKESLGVENRFVELTPLQVKQQPVLEVKQTQVYCEFEGLKIFLNAPQINDWGNLISGLLSAHRLVRGQDDFHQPTVTILVQIESLDFRKGMDSMVGLCSEVHGKDPFSGTYFLFRNKRRTALRILFFDGQGTWLCQKRFSKGRLRCWPKNNTTGKALHQLVAREVYTLIWNGDPQGARFGPEWKPLPLIKSD